MPQRAPSPRSWRLGIVAATPAFVIVHGSVLSEPLFLALLALFTWQLACERRGVDTKRTLVLGALAAAATLVRYAGASLVVAVVFEAWWTVEGPWRGSWRQRARRAFVAAELPVIVLAIWVLTRPHSEDAEKIRDVGLYTKGIGHTLMGGLHTAARWLAPGVSSDGARAVAAIAVLAALCALAVRTIRAARHGMVPAPEGRLYRATTIVLVSYLRWWSARRACSPIPGFRSTTGCLRRSSCSRRSGSAWRSRRIGMRRFPGAAGSSCSRQASPRAGYGDRRRSERDG